LKKTNCLVVYYYTITIEQFQKFRYLLSGLEYLTSRFESWSC